MKKFTAFVVILGIGYLVYLYLNREQDVIEVTGNITVIQSDGLDPEVPSVSTPLYKASIQGTAKNIGNAAVKEIWIAYKIAGEEVTAHIFSLVPGEISNFRTGSVTIKDNNPEYKLKSVEFEESK